MALDLRVKQLTMLGLMAIALTSGLRGHRDKSYAFAKAGVELSGDPRFGPLHASRVRGAAPHMFLHWKEPYHSCLEVLLSAYHMYLDYGLIEFLHQAIVREFMGMIAMSCPLFPLRFDRILNRPSQCLSIFCILLQRIR